jgi:NAD(P)-dependent dehydrogenase (short-subunit alcohol dehydrogenase family)
MPGNDADRPRRRRVTADFTGETTCVTRGRPAGGRSGAPPEGALPADHLNPTGRVATPEEVAALVAYLLSDEAAFVTGAAVPIDGGFTAQ